MVKVVQLTPEQVKAYEEMSGFETTGDVKLYIQDDAVMDLYESLVAG